MLNSYAYKRLWGEKLAGYRHKIVIAFLTHSPSSFFRVLSFFKKCYALGSCGVTSLVADVR